MKTIEIEKIQPDPLAAALASTDKETVTVTGYVSSVDKASISLCDTRDGISCTEYPRTAIIAAFSDEKSDKLTLLVDANARVKVVTTTRAGSQTAKARAAGGAGCGTECKSSDGTASCCCGVGQRCKSGSTTCICEDASSPLGGEGNFGGNLRPEATPDFGTSLDWPESPSAIAQSVPGGPSTVPAGYGRKCKRVPYWVCAGGRCWIEYTWECTYYPLPRAQFA